MAFLQKRINFVVIGEFISRLENVLLIRHVALNAILWELYSLESWLNMTSTPSFTQKIDNVYDDCIYNLILFGRAVNQNCPKIIPDFPNITQLSRVILVEIRQTPFSPDLFFWFFQPLETWFA